MRGGQAQGLPGRSGELHRRGISVYRVSAKRVHDSAEVDDGVPSLRDAKATELIAKLHWEGCSTRWDPLPEARREQLAQLQRLRQARTRAQAERNRLAALLARHWPELPHQLGLGSASLLHLVAAYGGPAALVLLSHQAGRLLRKVGGHWLAEETIAAVLASARSTLGMPCSAGDASRAPTADPASGRSSRPHRRLRGGARDVPRTHHAQCN